MKRKLKSVCIDETRNVYHDDTTATSCTTATSSTAMFDTMTHTPSCCSSFTSTTSTTATRAVTSSFPLETAEPEHSSSPSSSSTWWSLIELERFKYAAMKRAMKIRQVHLQNLNDPTSYTNSLLHVYLQCLRKGPTKSAIRKLALTCQHRGLEPQSLSCIRYERQQQKARVRKAVLLDGCSSKTHVLTRSARLFARALGEADAQMAAMVYAEENEDKPQKQDSRNTDHDQQLTSHDKDNTMVSQSPIPDDSAVPPITLPVGSSTINTSTKIPLRTTTTKTTASSTAFSPTTCTTNNNISKTIICNNMDNDTCVMNHNHILSKNNIATTATTNNSNINTTNATTTPLTFAPQQSPKVIVAHQAIAAAS